jgi:hypothetical protein
MSFTGSSVTAGHDSLLSEAFPALVYDTMGPAFRALGVELVVRNIAVGNNPCMPYDACLKVRRNKLAVRCHFNSRPRCSFTNKSFTFTCIFSCCFVTEAIVPMMIILFAY